MQKDKIKFHATSLVFFALFMLTMSYAAVPLYKLFCQVTGYGGTPMINKSNTITGEFGDITVRFDSSTEKNTPLFFGPGKKYIETEIGKNNLIFFNASNNSNISIKGTASFNVTPLQAAKYFNKIECFCFEEQVFEPGKEVQMPVSFFIDDAILDDKSIKSLNELTLSYTMYTNNE